MSRHPRARPYLVPLVTLSLAAGLLVAACGGGASPSPSAAPTEPPVTSPSPGGAGVALDGTRWVLVRGLAESADGATVDAVFEDGRVSGQGPCNRYFADVTVDGAALTIGPVGATTMSCGAAIDAAERAYFGALGWTEAHTIVGSTLTLLDGKGAEMLAFEAGAAATPTALPGTTWRVLRFAGEAGALVAVLPATDVTIEFGADGRFGGTAGCNSLGTKYTVDETAGTLAFGMMSTTLMLCEPPALMAQEGAMLAALEKTAAYAIADGRLQLLDASRAILVEAEQATAAGA
jgi:heat shock protein HslJ